MSTTENERKARFREAIDYLISIDMVDGLSATKNIADTMRRSRSAVSSAINGSGKYLTEKFVSVFCAKFKNIISKEWIWDGSGEMLNMTKYDRIQHSDTGHAVIVPSSTEETPRDRLIELRNWLIQNDPKCRKNETRILRMMGLGNGYFSTTEKQENKRLHSNTYKKIKKAWPEVNIEWLRTGEGDMFINPVVIEERPNNGVPYFDADFFGSFIDMVGDSAITPAYYIDFQPYNKKGNLWCNIVGDSMSPRINSGDKICIRRISIEDIIYGEIYAIDTYSDMRTVKWVTRSPENGMIRLVPENKDPRFGDYQDISLTDIRNIFKVIGSIRSF